MLILNVKFFLFRILYFLLLCYCVILATENSDFSPATANVYFNPGEGNNSRRNFLVRIYDDSNFEKIETFYVNLLTNDRSVKLATSRIKVFISDSDCK